MGFVIFGIRYNRLVCGTPEASQMGEYLVMLDILHDSSTQ